MTDRVVIEGHGLAVTIEQGDDPKRRRPKPALATPGPLRTIEDVLAMGNPYWTEAENREAELRWAAKWADWDRKYHHAA